MIYAIDPGTHESALVTLQLPAKEVGRAEIARNGDILEYLKDRCDTCDLLAVEMVQSFGMPVGASTFETVFWIGRFVQAWGGPFKLVYRKTVAAHLCKSAKAKDANIRQALIDRYPATGGGKTPQVGTKAKPGPLYGFKSHLWSALAVGLTAVETAP